MSTPLFVDPWRVSGQAYWVCSCGSTRTMPSIGRWEPGDTLWYLTHKEHGPAADAAPATTPEIPGQLAMEILA